MMRTHPGTIGRHGGRLRAVRPSAPAVPATFARAGQVAVAAAMAALAVGPLAGQIPNPAGSSKASHAQRVVCRPGLTLVGAKGVPNGASHGYRFEGTCRVQSVRTKDGKTTVLSEHLFPVRLEAAWDGPARRLDEAFVIVTPTSWNDGGSLLPVQGKATARYTCAGDPVIASASCSTAGHSNGTSLAVLSASFENGTPVSAGLASAAEAATLSKGTKSATPPPPPPAPTKPKIALKGGSGVARIALRSPAAGATFAGDSVVVEALLFEDQARRYRVGGIRLEWEVRNVAAGRAAPREPWQHRRVLGEVPWTGRDGRYCTARVAIPGSVLAEGRRWRIRASAGAGSTGGVEASEWVEFDVVADPGSNPGPPNAGGRRERPAFPPNPCG